MSDVDCRIEVLGRRMDAFIHAATSDLKKYTQFMDDTGGWTAKAHRQLGGLLGQCVGFSSSAEALQMEEHHRRLGDLMEDLRQAYWRSLKFLGLTWRVHRHARRNPEGLEDIRAMFELLVSEDADQLCQLSELMDSLAS